MKNAGAHRAPAFEQINHASLSAARFERRDELVKVREVEKPVAVEIACRIATFERKDKVVKVRKVQESVSVRDGTANTA